MCQYTITLAERAGHRCVSQCEHGTVHLLWDGIGIHLPQTAFLCLADAILKTLDTMRHRDDSALCGHCRLQVGNTRLCLLLDDFYPLAEMVEEALPQVGLLNNEQMQRLARLAPHGPRPALVLN
ncbi:MAG: hypothetical protein WDZ49_06730 [Litorilinea sp.]